MAGCAECGKINPTTRDGRRVYMCRGLCPTCYGKKWRTGTLDDTLHPRTPNIRTREIGARYTDSQGYVRVKPEGYSQVIGEHRYVMEQALGRPLAAGENVHHLNGVRNDNRIENLELWFKPQSAGQRLEDLLNYVVEFHSGELRARLSLDG